MAKKKKSTRSEATGTKKDIKQGLKCFVASPIGTPGSQTRKATDGLVDDVIVPVLKKANISCFVSHRIDKTGSITRDIISHLLDDDLLIANLTELNPNVMYELAVRHSVRKPVIIIASSDTKLPFDINDQRTIFYENTMLGAVALRRDLYKTILKCINEEEPDNPIYDVAIETIIKRGSEEVDSQDAVIGLLNRILINQDRDRTSSSTPRLRARARPYVFCEITVKSPTSNQREFIQENVVSGKGIDSVEYTTDSIKIFYSGSVIGLDNITNLLDGGEVFYDVTLHDPL